MESTFDSNPHSPKLLTSANGDEQPVTRREMGATFAARDALEELWRMGHLREHELMDIARLKAEAQIDVRLAGMNELRQQIDRERATLATRDLLDARIASVLKESEARLNAINAQFDVLEKAVTASQTAWHTGLADTNKALSNLTTRVMVTGALLVMFATFLFALAQFFLKKG